MKREQETPCWRSCTLVKEIKKYIYIFYFLLFLSLPHALHISLIFFWGVQWVAALKWKVGSTKSANIFISLSQFCGWIQIWHLTFFVTSHKKRTNTYVARVWMKARIANISPWLMISRPSAWTEFRYARSIAALGNWVAFRCGEASCGRLAWQITPNHGATIRKKAKDGPARLIQRLQ